MSEDPRRATPRADVVLGDSRLDEPRRRLGHNLVKRAVADALDQCRRGRVPPERVVDLVLTSLPDCATGLRRVVNATGVLVHTNLGRAPLSAAAVAALREAAGTVDVELDLVTGRRGPRGATAMAALSSAVPDAEAVHVVNNGAAALALTAAGLASGRSVVVARGELVEIGDGFRIPELMEASGARLREVGTTNRVHLRDYAAAVDESTAFILKVHPSNFAITGFTAAASTAELATLAPPVVVDIGSGLLAPHPRLPDEPSAAATLRAGADLVTASGDKLLGGPQCGLLLGRRSLVEALRRHPSARALRVDKLTLAALEATLTGPPSPVVMFLAVTVEELGARAAALCEMLRGTVVAEVVATRSVVGGGGAPGVELDSVAIALPPQLSDPLRTGRPAVAGRLAGGRLLLDLRAVLPEEDQLIVEAVRRAAGEEQA